MAQELIQQMTARPDGLDEALQQGQERMGQAEGDLRLGQPMQAEGSQAAASEHIRDAMRALERAMQSQRRQQQELEQGGQGGQSGPDEGGQRADDGEQREQEMRMDLPEPEEFRTPEEYRRALLRGMEAGVPEQYRALKKRYYEELVHQ